MNSLDRNFDNPFSWPRLGCGVGFRKEHAPEILAGCRNISWLELITENYLDSQGLPRKHLLKLRQDYPIVAHNVSLSIASTDPLEWNYLRKLKNFYAEVQPLLVSDHLCWTSVDHENLHQLLPLPRTEETIDHIVKRIDEVQEFLGRRVLFENISTYLDFSDSSFPEWEFLSAIADRADCGILLDLNNVYVNSKNHGYHAEEFLRHLPVARIGQFHLGGHLDMGSHLFDGHSTPVADDVWKLFETALQRFGPVSTLIEWDADIPAFHVLEAEVLRARFYHDKLLKSSQKVSHESQRNPRLAANINS